MYSFPIIDISVLQNESESALQSVGQELHKAAKDHGFFYISGHGIEPETIDSTFEVSARFFSLPAKRKAEVKMSGSHRGFLAIGESTMEGYSDADRKESFIWGLDEPLSEAFTGNSNQLLAPNRWPKEPEEMRLSLNTFFDAVHACSAKILRALAVSLGEPADFFTKNFNRPTSRGSIIYYPPNEGASEGYGVSPHSDFGCLSMLVQGGPGLSAQSADGQWREVKPIPNTFIANIGDLLSRWSNGKFRSVPHFVANKGTNARYSVVVFVDPDSETVIDPIVQSGESKQFDSITCNEYISGRFNRSFAYRN